MTQSIAFTRAALAYAGRTQLAFDDIASYDYVFDDIASYDYVL
jgi:hypothetical protein